MRAAGRMRRLLGRQGAGIPAELITMTDEDRRYLENLYDDSIPLPDGAEEALTAENPRLVELREAYASSDLPVLAASRWDRTRVDGFLDLRWFRGETLFYWHYRELPRITALKYFVFAQYVRGRDDLGLLDRLEEDGLFGCWTFEYPGHGRYSRDLLESVSELLFLERELGLSTRKELSVLDIGAGYGRLAHRTAAAHPGLADYCCVDAIAESTFLSEYYLGYRGCAPPARAVPLHEFEQSTEAGGFDLAINIHSWPEIPFAAVEWWVGQLQRLRVPNLFVVPNEPTALRSLEQDGSRRDLVPLLEAAGYDLVRSEPMIDEPAVRELLQLDDHYWLFAARA